MPRAATLSKAPGKLPYFSKSYSSTSATAIIIPFFEYVSRAKRIELALQEAELEQGESLPPVEALLSLVQIISKIKIPAPEPEASVFYGEAIVTWRSGHKEVSLVTRGRPDDPKLLRYVSGQNPPSQQDICPNATAESLNKSLRWLHE